MKRFNLLSKVASATASLSVVVLAGCEAYEIPEAARRSSAGLIGTRAGAAALDEPGDAGAIPAAYEPIDLSEYNGEADVFVAPQATAADVEGTNLKALGPVQDVMQVKLQDAIGALTDPQNDEQIHLRAIDQIMESLFLSNLVVLPTAGVPEEDPIVQAHDQALQDAINALNQHVDPLVPGTPDSKGSAWEARNFLQLMEETLDVIGQQAAQCDPLNLRDPCCQQLLDGAEGGVDVDAVFPGFSRQVRSPFFIGQGSAIADEVVIVPDSIGIDECAVILKEIQGVKAVVRKVQIPIWVEPWFARAQIVGFRTVWVWEFIPAEFLKTITYCNNGGAVVQDVDITVVLERELMHFWSFMNLNVHTSP